MVRQSKPSRSSYLKETDQGLVFTAGVRNLGFLTLALGLRNLGAVLLLFIGMPLIILTFPANWQAALAFTLLAFVGASYLIWTLAMIKSPKSITLTPEGIIKKSALGETLYAYENISDINMRARFEPHDRDSLLGANLTRKRSYRVYLMHGDQEVRLFYGLKAFEATSVLKALQAAIARVQHRAEAA